MGHWSREDYPGLQLLPKITYEHLHLTPGLRMKVNLAAQVMSKSVVNAFKVMNNPGFTSTVHFISMVNKFFDILNVSSTVQWQRTRNDDLKPFTSLEDPRLKWLQKEFLTFLKEWKEEAYSQKGLKAEEKKKFCLSHQTMSGCYITIHSYVEIVRSILSMDGVSFFLSDKLNQDPIEEFFGKQRAAGGHHSHPSVEQFSHHLLKNVVAGSSAVGSTRGNVRASTNNPLEITDGPLPKRKR